MKKYWDLLKRYKWYLISFVFLFLLATFCYSLLDYWNEKIVVLWCVLKKSPVELVTIFVLFITFLAIVWYSWETRKLRIETGKLRDVSIKTLKLNNSTLLDERFYKIIENREACIKLAKEKIIIPLEYGNNIFKMFLDDLQSSFTIKAEENYSVNKEKEYCHKLFTKLLVNKYESLQRYTLLMLDFFGIIGKAKLNGLDWDIQYYMSHFTLFNDYEVIFLFYFGVGDKYLGDNIDELDILKFTLKEELLLDKRHSNFYSSIVKFNRLIEEEKQKKGTSK
jgi:hypothetical protein